MELPPRARRILENVETIYKNKGTTSACAENTHPHRLTPPHPWNYLRVRGEYGAACESERGMGELPPRARRIRVAESGNEVRPGTTSACAENTSKALASDMISRNYLRVRGEYNANSAFGLV